MKEGLSATNTTAHFTLPKHISELDGLRAIAVLAVMCTHTALRFRVVHLDKVFQYGWTGVDLFFVLSGFLITGILIDSRSSRSYFQNFYARRILRIWPIYFLLVSTAFAIFPLIVSRDPYLLQHLPHESRSAWVYFAFLQNLIHCGQPTQLLLGVTWSLAIEEQFYLAWPLLVRFSSRRALTAIMLTILAVSPPVRWGAMTVFHLPPGWIYDNTITRLDGLAVGALLAIVLHSGRYSREVLRNCSLALLSAGALGAFLLVPPRISDHAAPLAFTSLALACGGAVGFSLSMVGRKTLLNRALNCPPLQYIGRISYCLYLVYLSVFAILNSSVFRRKAFFGETSSGDLHVILVGFAGSILCATLSWYLLEAPILKFKRFFVDREDVKLSKVSPVILSGSRLPEKVEG